MNLHPRRENGSTVGIIEPLIVEWIMDYCAFPKGKRKGGERAEGKEGVCEKPMLCDAAAVVVLPF